MIVLFCFSEKILTNKNRISELQVQQVTQADALRNGNLELRCKLTVHHQLISDVRSVLKGMAKCELENGPVSQYLEQYRQFSELCSSISRHLAAKEYDLSKMDEIENEVDQLQTLIGKTVLFCVNCAEFFKFDGTADPIYDGFRQLNEISRKVERRTAPKETHEGNFFNF